VRPNTTGNGGLKIGDSKRAAVRAQPTAQATLAPVSAARKRRQNGASAAIGNELMRPR